MAKIQTNLLTDIQIRKWIRAGSPVAKSDGGGLTFTLSAEVLDIGDLTSSRVRWGEPLTGSASDILREIEADEDSQEDAAEQASKFERARAMIYELLRPFASTRELKAAAAADGISWRTVETAKQTELAAGAKIRAVKQGKDWGWIWDTHAAN